MLRKLIFGIITICLVCGCGQSKEEKAKIEHEKCQLYISTMKDIIKGNAMSKGFSIELTPKSQVDIKQYGDNYIAVQKFLMDLLVEKENEDINMINELNEYIQKRHYLEGWVACKEGWYGYKDDCNEYMQAKENFKKYNSELAWVQESEKDLAEWTSQLADKVIDELKKEEINHK
jgi:hypothetical protein